MYKLVIADDEQMVLKGLRKLIDWQSLDIKIVGEAMNGKQALEVIEKTGPDIVICDIVMPGINGIELASHINECGTKCKFILLTSYSKFDFAYNAIRLGVVDYILKPTKPKQIVEAILKAKKQLLAWQAGDAEKKQFSENNDQSDACDKDHNAIIAYMKKYVRNNYGKKITLKEIADKVYFNPVYLCQLFKKYTQENFVEYVTKIKLAKAKELLLSPYFNVSEISQQVGYKDPDYFCRIFKKHTGMTPSEYKKKSTRANLI